MQFVAGADGFPLWISDELPGSTHDLTAAHEHGATAALYATAARGLPTLADKGYRASASGSTPPSKTLRTAMFSTRHPLPQHAAGSAPLPR